MIQNKKAASQPVNKEKKVEDSEDNLTPNQYTEIRKKKLEEMRQNGQNPYPHKFHVSTGIQEFIEKYSNLKEGDKFEGDGEISVAGRIHSLRASGTKLFFYDLRGESKLLLFFYFRFVNTILN